MLGRNHVGGEQCIGNRGVAETQIPPGLVWAPDTKAFGWFSVISRRGVPRAMIISQVPESRSIAHTRKLSPLSCSRVEKIEDALRWIARIRPVVQGHPSLRGGNLVW